LCLRGKAVYRRKRAKAGGSKCLKPVT
jgi:hypothetical protein